MVRVLVTGMSGTGKSTVLAHLAARGHRVADTDTDAWSEWVTGPHGEPDWVWRHDAMADLLTSHRSGTLFVAGCKTNQGQFYRWFEHVVLLSAPAEVLLSRIARRSTNDYGKAPTERALVVQHIAEVEPLLRRTATAELDATMPVEQVVQRLEDLVRGERGQ